MYYKPDGWLSTKRNLSFPISPSPLDNFSGCKIFLSKIDTPVHQSILSAPVHQSILSAPVHQCILSAPVHIICTSAPVHIICTNLKQVGVAQTWCGKLRPKSLRNKVFLKLSPMISHKVDNSKLGSTQQWMTLTCCQDHIFTENIWFVCSYSGDERICHRYGTNKHTNKWR